MVSSKNYLLQVIGEKSVHFTEFSALFSKGVTYTPVKKGIGILTAAKEDYQGGFLTSIRKLVGAEIVGSLLDQAQELLEAGYIGPAAVLTGCILEDHIKNICHEKQIELPDKPKLEYMNAQLAKIEYYNKLTQKQITSWADIRNSAAHGNWDQFKENDVSNMINGYLGLLKAANTACTGRGYRPKIRSAICKVWRDNIQESYQVRPAGNANR